MSGAACVDAFSGRFSGGFFGRRDPRARVSKLSENRYQIAIAVVRRGGKWLVARRFADAHLGGLWEFPGGKCEDGEPPTEAAIRELHEECGVLAEVERVLPAFEVEYPERLVTITPVICRWRDGEAEALESEECRWVTLAQMRKLEMPAANAAVVRELQMFA